MKTLTIVLTLVFLLFSNACMYHTPVQQGNVLRQEDVDEIKPGMSKMQIALILGTPAIADPYDQNRWDYVNTFKYKGKINEVKKLILFFDNDELIKTEGNYFPEKNSTTVEDQDQS